MLAATVLIPPLPLPSWENLHLSDRFLDLGKAGFLIEGEYNTQILVFWRVNREENFSEIKKKYTKRKSSFLCLSVPCSLLSTWRRDDLTTAEQPC